MGDANTNGTSFQNICAGVLHGAGIAFTPEYCIPNVLGMGGGRIKVDFYLTDIDGGVYVQCKSQDSSGTAWEKLPLVWCDIKFHHDKPTLIVVDGAWVAKMLTVLDSCHRYLPNAKCEYMVFDEFRKRMQAIGKGGCRRMGEFQSAQKRLGAWS